MSDGKLFCRSKSTELRAELEQAMKKTRPHNKIKIVMKKIIANINLNNNELVNLMVDVISLLKVDDLEIRKMCTYYIINYGPLRSKEALEALPYLQRFKDDTSPQIRCLAIKTMSSIPLAPFVDLTFLSVARCLRDPDSSVRKTGAFAVSHLYQHDPDRVVKENLITQLNELLYDTDQTVVSNALAALGFITENGKSLVLTIDKKHAMTLISYLPKANEWSKVYIMSSLMSFVPQTHEDALDLIEAIIPSLQHESSAVVLNTVKIIVYLSYYVKNPELIIPTLPSRLGSSLVTLLSKPFEIQFLVLRNIILLLLGNRSLVHFDVELFFCNYDDPLYIKDTKLEIIYLLATESNVHVVLRELEEYATDIDVSMARKAIRAFGNLAIKLPTISEQCVECIQELSASGVSYVVEEATVVFKNIIRKYPSKFSRAILDIVRHYKVINGTDAKTALIWILGQYCAEVENARTILEEITQGFREDPIEVQYASMTASVKYYLKFPSDGEKLVLKILKWATEDVDNPDVRDRGYIYWRLLSSDHKSANTDFQEVTKKIVFNPLAQISSENEHIDPRILAELELNIATLASIYLKPVHHVFRLAKRKHLPLSPVLCYRNPNSAPSSTEKSNDSTRLSLGKGNTSSAESFSYKKHSNLVDNGLNSTFNKPNSTRNRSSSSIYDSDSNSKKVSLVRRFSKKASSIAARK